jgi:hypothetical protein
MLSFEPTIRILSSETITAAIAPDSCALRAPTSSDANWSRMTRLSQSIAIGSIPIGLVLDVFV